MSEGLLVKFRCLTTDLLGSIFGFQDAFLRDFSSVDFKGDDLDKAHQEAYIPRKELARGRNASEASPEHEKQLVFLDGLGPLLTGMG